MNPISRAANPCCNYAVGVVLSLEEGDATTRFRQSNRWISDCVAAHFARAAEQVYAARKRIDVIRRE
jgi:hypothetical protein